MPLDTWLAFAAASALVLTIPGPTTLLVLSYAMGQGRRTALPLALGVAAGDLTAMTASMLGLGAVLAASGAAFAALKWGGAAYLVLLGAKLWRVGGEVGAMPRAAASSGVRMAGEAWLVTALNPKSVMFFVAFLPQFMDPAADPAAQMLILQATFLGLGIACSLGCALMACRAGRLIGSPRLMAGANRVGGLLLVGAAVATLGL